MPQIVSNIVILLIFDIKIDNYFPASQLIDGFSSRHQLDGNSNGIVI